MSSDILNQHLVGNGSNTQFTLLTSVANTSSVLVSINGLLSDPDIDYSVASNLITFTYAPYSTSDIEIRYLPSLTIGYTGSAGSPGGYQGSVGFSGSHGFTGSAGAGGKDGYIGSFGYTGSKGYTGSIGSLGTPSDIQTIITDGTTTYLLNKTPNNSKSILVAVNGLLQVPDVDYIVSGSNIVFNNIPPTGSDVEIIYFGNDVGYRGSEGFQGSSGFTGSAGAGGKDGYIGSFGYTGSKGYTGSAGIQGSIGYTGSGGWAAPSAVQVFLANGATSYSLSKIVAASKDILVSINGLLQVPDNDYTVSGSTISFNTIPISTSDIEILYFDIAGYIGSQGYLGSVGYKGSTGDNGLPGFVGSRGFVGSSGYTGSIGYSGSKGDGGIAAPSDIQVFNSNNSVTYSLVKSVTSSKGIMVAINGLLQVPDIDYSVSGTNLTFITQPQSNSDIEVIYFETAIGYQGSVGFVGSAGAPGGFTGYTGSKGTDGIIGYNGSAGYTGSKGYTGSVGIGYTGSGGWAAPSIVQVLNSTSDNNYGLSRVVSNSKDILVSVNGLLQIPERDYTVTGTILNFTYDQNPNSEIEILYFDVAGYIGSTGYKGSQGDPGGNTGYTGSVGATGPAGLGFHFRGIWDGSEQTENLIGGGQLDYWYSYYVNDVVYFNGDEYVCINPHTANTGNPTANTTNWQLFVPMGYTGSKGNIGFTGSIGPVGAPTRFQTIVASNNSNTYSLVQDVPQTVSIIVTINGLVQVPDNDYFLPSSNTIQFTNTVVDGSDIEILYFNGSGFTGSRGSVGYQGSTGAPGGPTGYTGSVGQAGQVGQGFNWRGYWNGTSNSSGYYTTYYPYDVVNYANNIYLCTFLNSATSGNPSSNSLNWELFVPLGYQGSRGYTGSTPNPSAPVRQEYNGDGVTNTFTVDTGYTPYQLDVYVNGIKLFNGLDVNVASGNTFTFITPPGPDDNIEVVGSYIFSTNPDSAALFGPRGYSGSMGIPGPAGGYTGSRGYTGSTPNPSSPVRQEYNGDGVTNTFIVDTGYTPYQLDVFVNGIKLFNGIDVDVSSGNTINFISPPGPDDNIEVVGSFIFSGNGSINVFGPRGYTGSAGEAQANSFSHLYVSGQPTLNAVGYDSLQIIAGDNIVLNTNNSTSPKTLTISSTAAANIGYGVNGSVLTSSNNGTTYWASRFFSGNSSIVPLYPNYGDIWFSTEYNRPLVWANNGYFDTWYDFSSPSSI